MKTDYYRVLGVSPDAPSDVIRRAWRLLAAQHHPDRHGDADGSSMMLLNEAWATLGNPSLRQEYDLSRRIPEPREVQDAVLDAARMELLGSGWTPTIVSALDLLLASGDRRVAVRSLRALDSRALEAWLPAVGVLFGGRDIDCAVLVACRVIATEETTLRVAAVSFPAAAIDLTESRAFGEIPPEIGELFGRFLIDG